MRLSSSNFYDRQGKPITIEQYVELSKDPEYKIVARTELLKGTVSTVWLGMDHSFYSGVPIIFETMVFCGKKWADIQERYSTEEEALAGHDRIVRQVTEEGIDFD